MIALQQHSECYNTYYKKMLSFIETDFYPHQENCRPKAGFFQLLLLWLQRWGPPGPVKNVENQFGKCCGNQFGNFCGKPFAIFLEIRLDNFAEIYLPFFADIHLENFVEICLEIFVKVGLENLQKFVWKILQKSD